MHSEERSIIHWSTMICIISNFFFNASNSHSMNGSSCSNELKILSCKGFLCYLFSLEIDLGDHYTRSQCDLIY